MGELAVASRRAALAAGAQRLDGCATPALDARLLLCAATGLDHLSLLRDPDAALTQSEAAAFERSLLRRETGEPVSRIIGRRGFWTFELTITPAVLDPRADTETLIEAALAAYPDRLAPRRILDLGTGSGAILCALLQEYPAAFGIGVDASLAAARVARANLAACGFASRGGIVCGDWAHAVSGVFDIIASNPPYVRSADIARLARDVRDHDPVAALDGGADGLDAYRAILPDLPRRLTPGGLALLEIGPDQAQAAAAIARRAGFARIETRRDLAGRDRVLVLRI